MSDPISAMPRDNHAQNSELEALRSEVATLRAELAALRTADDQSRLQAGYARTLVDEMYQFVVLLDLEGRLLEVNLPALTGCGETRADVIGRPMADVNAWQVSPEINAACRQSIRDAAAGKFVRFETQIFGGAGGTLPIWIDYSVNPVRDASGKIVFLLGEGRNITEKKLAEAEIARTTAELRVAHERLQEFDRVKTEFFANVSHELRTPLALILGPVRKRLAAGDLTPEERRDLEVVERNARTLLKHVNDLLDLSKLEAGRMTAQYVNVDLAHLMRLVASHFEVMAAERRIRYIVETPERLPAQVDAEKIQRIVLNLLSNAFKATPDAGEIHARLSEANGQASIEVCDTGLGVPVAMREVIFERFRQAEGASTRRRGGTGLGLAIVKEFVDLHGGSVSVGDAPRCGAQFEVRLPLMAPAGAEIASDQKLDEEIAGHTVAELQPIATSRLPQAPANAPLALVVEDNVEMNAFIAEALGRDYRVITALDGREGLEKALESPPDLIVSDVMMPRLSGDEMVHELRARQEFADVPIIMLTAKADDQLRVDLLKGSVQDYVAKPFLAEELLAKASSLVAQRRRAQEKVRAAERLTRLILDRAPVAAFIKDRQGRFTFANREAAVILGCPADQLIGKSNHDVLPHDQADAVHANDQAVLAAGEAVQREETVTRDGQSRTYLSVKFPLFDEHGEAYAVCGVSTDITEKKRAADELAQAKEAAEQASRAKDQFLAVVSHELRTPLNPILAATTLLRANRDLPDDMRESLDIVVRNVEQESRLVDDLLNWTRLARNKLDLHSEAVDAHAAVRTALAQFQSQMDEKEIELAISLRAKNYFIWADPGRLQQVLANLLANAVKFTPERGRIAVRSSNDDGRLRIEISDTGLGIEPAVLPRLFQPFEQGERSLARQFGGLGLGLAISKSIVDLHQGQLTATSEGRDCGATFMLELNTIPTVQPVIEPADGCGADRSHRRILLVEDHRDTLLVMTALLKAFGYEVTTATTVKDAMRLIECEPFDLLVSDIGLPDGSGLDIMRRVAKERQLKGIALSGFGMEEDQQRSRQAGFAEHLVKPVSFQSLRRVIERVLV